MRIDNSNGATIPILDAVREALVLWEKEEATKVAKESLLAETALSASATRRAEVEEDIFDADALPLAHTAHWGWGIGWWSRAKQYVYKRGTALLVVNLLFLGVSVFSNVRGKGNIKDDAARSY